MSAPAFVAVAAASGLLVGVLLHRALAGAGYRIDEERRQPLPRAGWLVVVAVPVVWALLAARFGVRADLAPLLLLAAVGVALARIDLDVHRLPEGLTLPALVAVLGLQLVAAAVSGTWGALGWAVLAGALSWAAFLVLALMSRGALGLGDATLAGLVGLALGYVDPAWPVLALVAAFVLGGLVAALGLLTRRLTLSTHLAFGPFVLLGALAVALAAPGDVGEQAPPVASAVEASVRGCSACCVG